ncbi:hypothetical protein ACFWP7_38595 [Streptomyces sp. NPDC058470]
MRRPLIARVQDNGWVKVTQPYDRPATHGNLHGKGRSGHQYVQNRG